MVTPGSTIEVSKGMVYEDVKSKALYQAQKNLRQVLSRKIDWTDIPYQDSVVQYLDAFHDYYFTLGENEDPRNKKYSAEGVAAIVAGELMQITPRGKVVPSEEEVLTLLKVHVQDPASRALQSQKLTALPRAATLVILDQVGTIT